MASPRIIPLVLSQFLPQNRIGPCGHLLDLVHARTQATRLGIPGPQSVDSVGRVFETEKNSMIKSILGNGGIVVANGSVSTPYINMSTPSAGIVRFNGNVGNFEVYDGSSWVSMYSAAVTVSLDYDVQTILNWARDKMTEDLKLKELAQKHPGIEDLKQKLAVMVALVQQQEKNNEMV